MKKLLISCRMSCELRLPTDEFPDRIQSDEITIPLHMDDDIADDILSRQAESHYVKSYTSADLTDILMGLARLLRYEKAEFIKAEAEN